ncbi:hypothetical protein MHBO_000787 [Bonamia ostreae]|uniref:CCHC-type domain-containing protein n=1 Tax=Bonamia ostreae TaxID=126728 RepID=A0ABV2AI21_9EUKA
MESEEKQNNSMDCNNEDNCPTENQTDPPLRFFGDLREDILDIQAHIRDFGDITEKQYSNSSSINKKTGKRLTTSENTINRLTKIEPIKCSEKPELRKKIISKSLNKLEVKPETRNRSGKYTSNSKTNRKPANKMSDDLLISNTSNGARSTSSRTDAAAIFIEEDRKTKRIRETKLNEKQTCLLIQGIGNPLECKNPIYLESKIKGIIPKCKKAKLLRFGDIKVWMESEQDRNLALDNSLRNSDIITSNFGEYAKVLPWRNTEEMSVLHRIPSNMEDKQIENFMSEKKQKVTILKRIENSNKQWLTLFVRFSDEAVRKRLTDRGYVRIGFSKFRISKYERRVPPICFNCQKYGHVAKVCFAKSKCRNCAESHSSRDCPNEDTKKCINCKGKHKSGDKNCIKRKKYINRFQALAEETVFESNESEDKNTNNIFGWTPTKRNLTKKEKLMTMLTWPSKSKSNFNATLSTKNVKNTGKKLKEIKLE